MLIHADGLNRGDAPIKLYHSVESSGTVLVGDAKARILLTREEVLELYKLLEPFVRSHSASSPAPKDAFQSKD